MAYPLPALLLFPPHLSRIPRRSTQTLSAPALMRLSCGMNGTRTDCLNAQYAVEIDYTYKWAEGVGQALYYAELHQRTPGIIFVCHPETTDELCDKHVKRAMTILSTYAPQSWSGVAARRRIVDECDTHTINPELADEGTSGLNVSKLRSGLN